MMSPIAIPPFFPSHFSLIFLYLSPIDFQILKGAACFLGSTDAIWFFAHLTEVAENYLSE